MTAQASTLAEQQVVRHYRATTRSEVEQAYRAEALHAAQGGYVPIAHSWSQEPQGFLLAVTYGAAMPAAPESVAVEPASPPMQPPQPTIVAPEPQPITIREPNGPATPKVVPPRDEFRAEPPRSPGQSFAPAGAHTDQQRAEAQWLAPEPATPAPVQPEPPQPVQRYSPPPEMYTAPPDMYIQVDPGVQVPQQPASPPQPLAPPQAVPVAPAAPAAAEAARYSRQALLTIQTMDLHAGGEPLRMIRSGFPDVPHLPVMQRREWVKQNADHVRRALMLEPRGHRDMYGAILLPPYNDYADMTVLFMHNEGYSTMCGHGIIAITTGLIEEGLYPASEPVTTIRYEVPAGIVAANAATVKLEDGTWAVRGVRFTNVPSYLAAQSLSVRPDGVQLHGAAAQYGALGVDLAFGGAYYGIVNAAELGLRVVPDQADALRRAGAAITEVLRRDHTPSHPTDPALSFVYGTIIVDLDPRSSPDGKGGQAHIRNATVFADAELDRSPCGSGTSAILAQLHARGRMRVGQELVNAGISGEHFLGRIEAETALGPYPAISTSVAGTAYVTGYSTFIVDSRDPLGEGFLVR